MLSGKRLRVVSIAIGFALTSAESVTPPASAGGVTSPTYPPEATGVTVIDAEGTSGISLRVPSQTGLRYEGIDLELRGAEFVYAGIAPRPCPEDWQFEWNKTCLHWGLYWVEDFARHFRDFPGWFLNPTILVPDPSTVEPGLLDIYIVSDGPLTLTLRFDGLSGSSRYRAAGSIDAAAEQLSPECPETGEDCTNFGHGGKVRTAAERAFAAAISYSWVPRTVPGVPEVSNRGSASAVSCLYPGPLDASASPQPADHPRGCDISPMDRDHNWNRTYWFLGSAVSGNSGAGMLEISHAARASQYVGFVAEQATLVNQGGYAGWGLWVNLGITCDAQCAEVTSAPA